MTTPPDKTLQGCFQALRNQLAGKGIATSELDARLLIQAATRLDHAQVILHADRQINEQQLNALNKMAKRRLKHEPVSRILGTKEFYGRQFKISPAVLDPRPDTETLIDLALSATPKNLNFDILDIGTGTGAIIITMLCERVNAFGIATDISSKALQIAEQNARNLKVNDRLQLIQTSWCDDINQLFDLIVSNPPYIASNKISQLAPDVKNHDPHLALDGGTDGLDPYREIARQVAARLKPDGIIMLEIGHDQAADVTEIFTTIGFTNHHKIQPVSKDFGGNDRVVTLIWSKTKK